MLMASTVTISLPATTLKKVRAQVATGKFASTSEFFRDLIRHWEENNLLQQIAQNKKEKPKKLSSFKEWL